MNMPEERPSGSLEEIFGADLWSEPEDDESDRREERLREREYRENRPPHYDWR